MSSPAARSNSILVGIKNDQSPQQNDLLSFDEGTINTIRSDSEQKDAIKKPLNSTPKPMLMNAEKSVFDSSRKFSAV